jgi:hypothetical protein
MISIEVGLESSELSLRRLEGVSLSSMSSVSSMLVAPVSECAATFTPDNEGGDGERRTWASAEIALSDSADVALAAAFSRIGFAEAEDSSDMAFENR